MNSKVNRKLKMQIWQSVNNESKQSEINKKQITRRFCALAKIDKQKQCDSIPFVVQTKLCIISDEIHVHVTMDTAGNEVNLTNQHVPAIDCLNDDCLRHILGMLRLKDQIAALRSWCRFEIVLDDMWFRQYKMLDLDFYFDTSPLTHEEISYFVYHVHDHVEIVRLEQIPRSVFDLLRKYKFEKASELYISIRWPHVLCTLDVLKLQETFPNLRSFQPCGKFSGQNFRLWKKMEYLALNACHGFQVLYIEQMVKEMPLKTLILNTFKSWTYSLREDSWMGSRLEVLTLNSCELQMLLPDHIRFLKHLKQLHITDEYEQQNVEDLNSALGRYRNHSVVSVCTRNVHLTIPVAIDLGFYHNLHSLWCFSDPMAFRQVVNYVDQLTALRELKFFACRVRNEADFQRLFRNTPHVDFISLETCAIDVDNLTLDVHQVMRYRSKPLRFNFYNNWLGIYSDVKIELHLVGRNSSFMLTDVCSNGPRCRFLTYYFK